jgi:hypothetical protein
MKKGRSKDRPFFFPVHRINGTDIVPRCAESYKPCRTKPLPNGSFGIVSNAPVTGPKKEFAIGVNDRRWHNLKRCGGFHSAAKSTESGRGDRARIVRAVEGLIR